VIYFGIVRLMREIDANQIRDL